MRITRVGNNTLKSPNAGAKNTIAFGDFCLLMVTVPDNHLPIKF